MHKTDVASSTDVREGEKLLKHADGVSLILTRVKGKAYAVENKCSHLGMSMSRGKLEDGTIQCPWHGSKFDVCTGKNLDWANAFGGLGMPKWTHGLLAMGKDPSPIRSFEVTEEAGRVFVTVQA